MLPHISGLIDEATDQVENDGLIHAHTAIALANEGIDPDKLAERVLAELEDAQ